MLIAYCFYENYDVPDNNSTFNNSKEVMYQTLVSTLRTKHCPLKEVIQPHLPVGLPCYDFIPVISLTLDTSLLAVKSVASGETNSHDVTGGVYKARERIHDVVADTSLLAIPTSCSRVADYNLN